MNTLIMWGEAIAEALSRVWVNFILFVPKLVGAAIVMVLGIFIAIGIAKLGRRIVNAFRITAILKKTHLDEVVEKAGLKFDVGNFFYWLIKWFLVAVFFMAATEIVDLHQISSFLEKILLYLPNVMVAVLIMFIGIILANFLAKVVSQSAQATSLSASARFLAGLTRWSVLIFSLMAALIQLKVAVDLIRILFIGLVAMLAIAGGIAFGIGGTEEAKKILKKITDLRNRK